jgi:hypothetical protein
MTEQRKKILDRPRPREASRRLGALVRERREDLGLSQGALITAMEPYGFGWYQSTLTRLESGTRMVTFDEAVALAAVLDFDLNEAGGIGPMKARRRELQERLKEAEAQAVQLRREVAEADEAIRKYQQTSAPKPIKLIRKKPS